MTVAGYLATRLEQLGIKYLFGVPGNHFCPFLDTMNEYTDLEWRGNTNEINGGFAADGYGRVKGISAVGVTYGVGALSLINTIGGAFVEHVPIVVINAAPTYEQHLNYQAIGLLTSHMSPNKQSNLDAYRQVTVDAQQVTNGNLAPVQIDAAITKCLTEKRPVYLEIFQDVFTAECAEVPKEPLQARPRGVNAANVEKAVAATVQLIEARKELTGLGPIFWGGVEIDRKKLAADFEDLVDTTNIPYCTSIMGKGILSEQHPLFHGVYNGKASPEKIDKMFNGVGCRIGLGAWSTSKNLGGIKWLGTDWVTASHNGVRVGTLYFPDVNLGAFIRALKEALAPKQKPKGRRGAQKKTEEKVYPDYYKILADAAAATKPKSRGMKQVVEADMPANKESFFNLFLSHKTGLLGLSYNTFFDRINKFIGAADKEITLPGGKIRYENPYGIVADAGFSLLGSQNVRMAVPSSYFSQTSWLSIGYSVGAVTGLKSAFSEDKKTDKRMMVFVGDGSFQETCQAMSSHARHKQNNIVFIMNNENFYGIEQMLVQPLAYSRVERCKVEKDSYNNLHPWKYAKLAEVFSAEGKPMHGHVVRNHEELNTLLERFDDAKDPINEGPNIVQLLLKKADFPRSIDYKVREAEKRCAKMKEH